MKKLVPLQFISATGQGYEFLLINELSEMLYKILLSFASNFRCAGQPHAPRTEDSTLINLEQTHVHTALCRHIAAAAAFH